MFSVYVQGEEMSMKRVFVYALCGFLSAGIFSGCSGSGQSASGDQGETVVNAAVKQDAVAASAQVSSEEEDKDPIEIDTDLVLHKGARIAVVAKCTKGSYWEAVESGMKAAVDRINEIYDLEKEDKITMTFEGPDDETGITDQINTIDAVLSENPSVLCLAAIDQQSCQAQLETARENGIPVIMFDSGVNNEDGFISAYCGTDNIKAGSLAADKLAEELGEKGKVAVFAQQKETQSVQQRVDGFLEELSKYPELTAVEVLYSDETEDYAAAITEVIEENEEIKGVFCVNGETAQIWLDTMGSFEEREFVTVGFDADSTQQKAVEDGTMLGVVSQQPYLIGYQTMYQAILQIQETETQEEQPAEYNKILLEPGWIDAQNLDSEEMKSYLYS